jgi:hypothetical protein
MQITLLADQKEDKRVLSSFVFNLKLLTAPARLTSGSVGGLKGSIQVIVCFHNKEI